MAEDTSLERRLTIRVTDAELDRIERLRERLQEKMPAGARATQRTVFLEALNTLEGYFQKLDKDRSRER